MITFQTLRQHSLSRWASLVLLLGALFIGLARSEAEFEVPLIDTTASTTADFNGVWSYYRNSAVAGDNLNPDNSTVNAAFSGYEAWAVGKNLQAGANPSDLYSSVLYYFDGSKWKNIIPTLFSTGTTPAVPDNLYAVSGQYDPAQGYAQVWVGGKYDSTKAWDDTNNNQLFEYSNLPPYNYGGVLGNVTLEKQLHRTRIGDGVCNSGSYKDYACTVGTGNAECGGGAATCIAQTGTNGANVRNTIYAIGAGTGFHNVVLAGGQGGLLLKLHAFTGYSLSGYGDWTRLGSTVITTAEHITGISFAENSFGYITTTQHPGANTDLDRTCPTGSIGRIYRFDRDYAVTKIGERANTCFFGVTAATIDTPSVNNGPLQTNAWIAVTGDATHRSSGGVYKLDDDMSSSYPSVPMAGPLSTSAGHSATAVTSTRLLGGSNANLLRNGNFESWDKPNPTSDPKIHPTAWTLTAEGIIGRNNASGSCGADAANALGNTKDVMADSSVVHQGAMSLLVAPDVYYNSYAACIGDPTSANGRNDQTVSVFKTVNLSNIEARKFKVSGWVNVHVLTALELDTRPAPKYVQGGVSTTCAGGKMANDRTRTTVDCGYTNRSAIQTADTNGWKYFEYVVSRNNGQFTPPLIGYGSGNPRVTDDGTSMEVHCEATYGVQVWCDDIKVVPIDQPTAPYQNNINVIATDSNGAILDNPAAISSNGFIVEGSSTSGLYLNAISAAGPQHVYVVGNQNTLASRIPGNVTGYIWAGTSTSTANATAAGWLSASCVDIRDASNRTLCQLSPASYGLDFSSNVLSGRAWFGKTLASSTDQESLNLGRCIGNARRSGLPPEYPYLYGYGSCLTSGRCSLSSSRLCTTANETADCLKSCDVSTRTCVADSSKSCIRDSDCMGRCELDSSVFCAVDADCRGDIDETVQSSRSNPFFIGYLGKGLLGAYQSTKLQCGTSSNPQACTGLGWLSFNVGDTGTPPAPLSSACPAGTDACYNNASGQSAFAGAGRFLTLASDPSTGDPNAQSTSNAGWVSLRGQSICDNNAATPQPSCPASSLTTSYFGCFNCSGSGCGFCRDQDNHSCSQATGCSYFCQETDGSPTAVQCSTNNDCLKSLHSSFSADLPCRPKGYCSNDTSVACTSNGQCTNGTCVLGAVCTNVTSCDQYGVNLDPRSRKFSGYAWSEEFGWLDFSGLQHGNVPFLQTRLGDIYAQGDIGDSTTFTVPGNTCNATYLLTSGRSITNFCTRYSSYYTQAQQTGAVSIPFGTNENAYTTTVGRFDLDGIARQTNGTKNKYGSVVQSVTPQGATNDLSAAGSNFPNGGNLGGKVYTVGTTGGTTTYTLDQAVTLNNASIGNNGAGILVVNGNLRINQNMSYGTTTNVTDLRQLASLAVFVQGNLYIDNAVTQVVGTYYVSGTICTGSNDSGGVCDKDNWTPAAINPNQYPLTWRGLLIARDIVFTRTFAGTTENPLPSELIIFDGRLQSNPMPGLIDFAKTLPLSAGQNP